MTNSISGSGTPSAELALLLPSGGTPSGMTDGKHDESPKAIRAARCAKCGKEIPVGQEVKKGFLMKKSYHKECAG